MKAVISVENLGKRYRLGELGGINIFMDLMADLFRNRGLDSADDGAETGQSQEAVSRRDGETLWALKDVGFEIAEGELVAFIGSNGAGKSTLLKILARITRPTRGRIRIRGRVGSLLEVGTGFHPDLTGRENVFMNGAIIGMSRAEINRKFDEIVDFSGVEKFIDTPVKRYSSGMYVRLAFAVAAHFEPEILLVDEVLAVGDTAFQKKCMAWMNSVIREGRTIILVSHNLGVVAEIARRGIWLEGGRLRFDGGISEAIDRYLARSTEDGAAEVDLAAHPNRRAGMRPILKRLVLEANGRITANVSQTDTMRLSLDFAADSDTAMAGIGFFIYTTEGQRVGCFNNFMASPPPHSLSSHGRLVFELPARQFTPGGYLLTVSCSSHNRGLEDVIDHALRFFILPADIYGTGYLLNREHGIMTLDATMVKE